MNLSRIIFSLIFVITLYSCADYSVYNINQSKEKKYYSSSGFALIYEDALYKLGKIFKELNFRNKIGFKKMNILTASWYKSFYSKEDIIKFTRRQILDYRKNK